MKQTLRPMLVTAGPLRPDHEKYAFEVKWDGFRALVQASPGSVTIVSRNGHDMTSRYPELRGLGDAVQDTVVLDGEIVMLNSDGFPDFAALWFRGRSGKSSEGRLCFMVFDLLQEGAEELIDRPYTERRALLESLQLEGPHWCSTPSYIGDGSSLFAATKRMRLEGVVAKRVDSRYQPGIRSRSWTKTKHFQYRNFALIGWLPPEEWRGDRGCVVLGLSTQGRIAVAGVVESGYGSDLVEQLPRLTRRQLRALQTPGSVWDGSGRMLTGKVKYLEWSLAGGLRHASIVEVH